MKRVSFLQLPGIANIAAQSQWSMSQKVMMRDGGGRANGEP